MLSQEDLKKLGLKTGDLILFSGDSIVADVVESASKSKWAHSGIIFVDPNDNAIKFFESKVYIFVNKSCLFCSKDGVKIQYGVQINPFDKILEFCLSEKLYSGAVVRRLVNPLTQEQLDNFTNLTKNYSGIPYEQDPFCLLESVFGPTRITKVLTTMKKKLPKEEEWIQQVLFNPDLHSMFCSQLVMKMYEDVGIITGLSTQESEIYLFAAPSDLSSSSQLKEFGKDGTILGPEEILVGNIQGSQCCNIS
jgi:hypothetical protein